MTDRELLEAAAKAAGIQALSEVVRLLRKQGHYEDDEGEATNQLTDLLNTLKAEAAASIDIARLIAQERESWSEAGQTDRDAAMLVLDCLERRVERETRAKPPLIAKRDS